MNKKNYKNIFSMRTLFSVLFLSVAMSLYADDGDLFTANTIEGVEMTFKVVSESDKTCAVGRGTIRTAIANTTTDSITIPSVANEYTVVGINAYAFYGCQSITGINIPKTVKTIGSRSFQNCSSLTNITIPAAVEEIGESAFRNCQNLSLTISKIESPFNISETVFGEIANDAILEVPYNTKKLYESTSGWTVHFSEIVEKSLIIATINSNKPLIEIARQAYWIAWDATEMTKEDAANVKNLFNYFNNATELLSFDEFQYFTSITELGNFNNNFKGCVNLERITLPASITNIQMVGLPTEMELGVLSAFGILGQYSITPFDDCTSLAQINVIEDNPCYTSIDGILFSKNLSKLILFPHCKDIGGLVFPASTNQIGNFAFLNCGFYYGSYSDSRDNTLTIPATIELIGTGAFAKNRVSAFIVDKANPNYSSLNGNLYNKNQTNLIAASCQASSRLPESLTSIGDYAFSGDGKSDFISFPPSLKTIGIAAFWDGTLQNSPLPSSLESIGAYAFYGCQFYDSNLTLPNSIKSIDYATFMGAKTNHVNFSNTLEKIGSFAFAESSITSIQIPNTIKRIERSTFSGCKQLRNVTLPILLTTIGPVAFMGNEQLKSIDLPNSLIAIEDNAFGSCTSLESIQLPNSLTQIGFEAFNGCTKLESVDIPPTVAEIKGFSNCTSLNKVILHEGAISIDEFSGCSALEEITLPTTVTSIGYEAFSFSSLRSIDIPNGVSSIGSLAFLDCPLTSVVLPDSIEELDLESFSGTLLTSLTIPEACKKVDLEFTPYHLENLVLKSPMPPSTHRYHWDEMKRISLYVPLGAKNTYETDSEWKKAKEIVETNMDEQTFEQDSVFYSYSVGNPKAQVNRIEKSMGDIHFVNRINFGGIDYIPYMIGHDVFSGNKQMLNTITFPSTINDVAEKAFNKCAAAAFIWESDIPLTEQMFADEAFAKNFLLYVNKLEIAPSNIGNIIVGDEADNIVLHDAYRFHCPRPFTAKKISYTHNYQMVTGLGTCSGWETIALPFDVQTVTHQDGRNLTPFVLYQEGMDSKPYWLYSLTGKGFEKASTIKANTPYLISMPHNSQYSNEYNLNGAITFAAENVVVKKTVPSEFVIDSYEGSSFVPSYELMDKHTDIYTLNVSNDFFTNLSAKDLPGSVFLLNERPINPFECYFYQQNAKATKLFIPFADDYSTNIIKNERPVNEGNESWYTLDGRKLQDKPSAKGLYIRNGQKVLSK